MEKAHYVVAQLMMQPELPRSNALTAERACGASRTSANPTVASALSHKTSVARRSAVRPFVISREIAVAQGGLIAVEPI
jgi:hypothetical protein